MGPIPRTLVIAGMVLVIIGLMWQAGGRLGPGRLPGDFVLGRGNVRVYVPLATSLIVSAVLSAVFLVVRLLSR